MMPLIVLPLIFLWDFDRTVAQTQFLVLVESVAGITGSQKLLVAGVASGMCANLPTGTAEAFCVTMACPGPGTFRVTVEAIRYKTRSNTVHLRVLDPACRRVEGAIAAPAQRAPGTMAGVPAAAPCRPPTIITVPPVEVTVASQQTLTVAIPTPHLTAPVMPVNPEVVPKTPHVLGEVPLPTMTAQAPLPIPATHPPPLTVPLPTGPPTTVTVTPPPVEVSGVPCP
jgi:hypothetical protein